MPRADGGRGTAFFDLNFRTYNNGKDVLMQRKKKTNQMARPGRPALPPTERRSCRLMLRVTEQERAQILAEAKRKKTTVTELLIGPWRTDKDDC